MSSLLVFCSNKYDHLWVVESLDAIGETLDTDFVAQGGLSCRCYPGDILFLCVAREQARPSTVWTVGQCAKASKAALWATIAWRTSSVIAPG